MSPSLIITLEILCVLGVVVGLGGWQLISIRRELRIDRARRAQEAEAEARARQEGADGTRPPTPGGPPSA